MTTHILIPSVDSYGIMLLITLSLGSFPISRHIHIRWLKNYFSFVGANAAVKSAIALLGLFVVNPGNIFTWNVYRESYSILIGIILGIVTIFFEMKIIRRINRKRLLTKNYKVDRDESQLLRNSVIKNKISLSSAKSIQAKGLTNVRTGYSQYAGAADFLNYSLISVIVVAIAEEFLFRGYTVTIAKLMHNEIMVFMLIVFSTILFACSHMSNSWNEFVCKLPLSILTMMGFLMTGSLLTAIVTHVVLNIYAYLIMRRLNIKDVTYNYLPVGAMR